jgi:mRNA degradation ribonuclease J1/J2
MKLVRNTCVFEYNDEILILDAGLAFPTEDMHGVNIVSARYDLSARKSPQDQRHDRYSRS